MVACLSPFESNYLDSRTSRKRHAGDPIRFDIRPVTIKNKQLAVRHEWSQVTFKDHQENVEIRLHGEDTKTGEQRMVVMGGDLYDVLRAWYKVADCLREGRPRAIPKRQGEIRG